jgi:diguanylate cyclase (GGDEF)-like protein
VDQLEHEFRQRLISGIRVLSRLVKALDQTQSATGPHVMRKLAASLRRSSEIHGYPHLIAAAAPFESAPVSDLPMLGRRLLRVMDVKLGETLARKLGAPTREVIHTRTVSDAWKKIDQADIALIVLDLVLPDADGRNLLSKLRADPRTSMIPIVVLSDWAGHDLRAECFALGADHFFQKSGDLDLLAIAVASTLHRTISQARDSNHDAVTQLLSREGLRNKFERMVKRATKKAHSVTLVVVDVDLSKAKEGQPEELLRGLVHEIRLVLRPTDVLGRWNEAELVLLLGKTDREGAARVLERIREALDDQDSDTAFRPEFAEAIVKIGTDMTLDAAVAEADRSLFAARYERKEVTTVTGRPRILIADTDAENVIITRQAFEKEGFEVSHFQAGRDVLKAASAGRVDLILVDLKLDDMSGLDLVERLREKPRLGQTALLMTSVDGRDAESVRAFDLGVDDFVIKPCTSVALVARMRRLLKRAGPPTSGPLNVMRKVGAMAGLFAGDQLLELVQMLGLNRKTGRLVLSSEAYSGNVDFLEGMITKAWTTTGKDGSAACEHLFDLAVGRFEFWPGAEAVSMSGELLRLSVDNLLLDAMRRQDEAGIP